MTVATHLSMPKARHRLEPGDRLPDFILADQTDAVRAFYQRVTGRGMVVFLDSTEALRQSLRDLAEAYQAAQLDCLAIDATAKDPNPLPCIVADEAGRIRQGLRDMSGHPAGAAGARPLAFLLDRNQCILALSDEGDLARWALARWSEEPAAAPAAEIRHAAPVLTVPNVLSREDCRALIARWHEAGHEPGTVTSMVKGEVVHRLYEDLKKRRDHRISDPAVRKPLMAMVARRLGPEVNKAFCYGSFQFDRVLIACYDAERGDYFRRHRDNSTPATAHRRFALTLNLNSDEYDGGELVFPEYGDYRYKPPTGAAVVFSCSLLHEALPVTRGQRFALLSFLRDLDQTSANR
ncbi:MAG TPA: 2OG-Fe(II) oxygenase [Dongiaceae bacterium]|nr:2OG-Fe(II) oxygenase [Dongiaceae bacterium]